MPPISYAVFCFQKKVIQHAVWIYLRFTLSYRDVEDLLAARGLDVSYETVRRWVLKFGYAFAQCLRHCRPTPSGRCHSDEMLTPWSLNQLSARSEDLSASGIWGSSLDPRPADSACLARAGPTYIGAALGGCRYLVAITKRWPSCFTS